jgi:tRNA threonylcarbamoyl adenosine modification protein YeaZ
MIILGIETSTNCGSIALLNGEECIFTQEFAGDRSLGTLLFEPIQKAVGMVPRIDLIVVGVGPGSYSGVRIAISAAMGLSISTGARLVGISSLVGIQTQEASYFAVGDARRSTFYFTSIRDRECVEGPLLLSPDELRNRLTPSSLPVFTSALIEEFPEVQLAFPSAEILARLASQGKGIIAKGDLEPIYLRDPHITMPKALR